MVSHSRTAEEINNRKKRESTGMAVHGSAPGAVKSSSAPQEKESLRFPSTPKSGKR